MQKYVFSMSSPRKAINYYYFFTSLHTSPPSICGGMPHNRLASDLPALEKPDGNPPPTSQGISPPTAAYPMSTSCNSAGNATAYIADIH